MPEQLKIDGTPLIYPEGITEEERMRIAAKEIYNRSAAKKGKVNVSGFTSVNVAGIPADIAINAIEGKLREHYRTLADETEGITPGQRAIISGSDLKSQVETLKQFYDDVRLVPITKKVGGAPGTRGVVTEDQALEVLDQGKWKRINPKGFDVGDITGAGRQATEFATSALGAAGGTAISPGAGSALGAGIGSVVGDTLYNEVAKAFGLQDVRTTGEKATDAATLAALSAAGEAVAPQIGRLLRSSLKGGLRGGVPRREVADQIASTVRATAKDTPRTRADKLFDVPAGLAKTLGESTQVGFYRAAEGVLSKMPFAARKFSDHATKIERTLGERSTTGIIRRLGGPQTLGQAGKKIKRGMDAWYDGFRQMKDLKYAEIEAKYQIANTVGPMRNLRSLAVEHSEQAPILNLMPSPTMRRLSKIIKDDYTLKSGNWNTVRYDDLKKLRTEIGDAIGSGELPNDTRSETLRRIFGAASKDMEEIAEKIGPEAARDVRVANSYYKAHLDLYEKQLIKLWKKITPEQLGKQIETFANTREASSLMTLRKIVGDENWGAIQAYLIKRMGILGSDLGEGAGAGNFFTKLARKATELTEGTYYPVSGSSFNLSRFFRTYNKLEEPVKRALFGKVKRGGVDVVSELDDIARTAAAFQAGGSTQANPLFTMTMLTLGAGAGGYALGGTMTAIGGIAAAGAGASLAGRFFTSPTLVKWLAKTTDPVYGNSARGISSHLARLGAIYKSDTITDSERAAIQQFLGTAEQWKELMRGTNREGLTAPVTIGGS